MKQKINIAASFSSLVLVMSSFASVLAPVAASAAPGANTVYINPSSNSAQIGSNVTVDVRFNPSTTANGGYDGVDGIDTTVTFPTATLQYVGVDASGSAFASGLLTSAGSGTVRVARAQNIGDPFVTADSLAFHVTFKALAAGTAAVGLTSTQTTHGSAYTSPSVQGGSVSVTSAPTCPAGQVGTPPNCTTPTCPTGQVGTPPNCTTPNNGGGSGGGGTNNGGGSTTKKNTGGGGTTTTTTTTTTNTGTTTTTPTTNTDDTLTVAPKKVEFSNASFSVTTATPTQVYIQYGTSNDALSNSTQPDALGTSHEVALDPSLLVPGQTYYYVIVTKDASGKIVESKVQSFTTKGLTVSVGVFDANHQPIKHKQVTLHSVASTATTDDKGYAVFSNVIPGDHHVTYTDGSNKTFSQPVQVQNNVVVKDGVQSSATQNFSVTYAVKQAKSVSALPFTVLGLVIVAAAAGYYFMVFRKRPHPVAASTMASSVPPVASTSANFQPVQFSATPQANEPKSIEGLSGPSAPVPGSMVTPKDDASNDSDRSNGN